jgi:hypothetical protein
MWLRISCAVGGATLGLVLGSAVPLFLFGFLFLSEDIALSVRGDRKDASELLFFMATACATAIALGEALIWLLRGQDNDKRKFFKRVGTGLGVGILLLGTIRAIATVFAHSRLAEYQNGPFVYYLVLSCAIAGALAAGLLRLLEVPHSGPGIIVISGHIKGYARRAALGLGLGALMWLSYSLLSPSGRWVALGLLSNEPFAKGMPVGFWRHRLESSDKKEVEEAKSALEEWETERVAKDWGRPRIISGRDKRLDAALALRDVEQRVAALTEVLKSEDLFTCERAAEALAQIGPEAKPAVPALLELWWRSDGLSLVKVADAIESIEPGALKRARIERYLTRSAIAGTVMAFPVFGVLWLLSRARRAEKDWWARRRALPNPFEQMAEPDVPQEQG